MHDNHQTQLRCFGIGPARTGTRFLSSIFSKELNATHEQNAKNLINTIRNRELGNTSNKEFSCYLDKHFSHCGIDVSHVNYLVMDWICLNIPNPKFILTYRNPRDWLESFISHSLRHKSVQEEWLWLREYRFRPQHFPHNKFDSKLLENGLHSLDGYLSYYGKHIRDVATCTDKKSLLSIRTEDLSSYQEEIANFLGINVGLICMERGVKNDVARSSALSQLVSEDYLQDRINAHCSEAIALLEQRANTTNYDDQP